MTGGYVRFGTARAMATPAAVIPFACVLLAGAGCQSRIPARPAAGQPAAAAPPAGGALEPKQDVSVEPLADQVWLHTSYKTLPDIGPFRSNGLIVQTPDGVYLIDTAWDDRQTEVLLRWAREHLRAPIEYAIVTHAHDDKMGGVAALHRAGVETFAFAKTNEAAPGRGLVPTKRSLPFGAGVEALPGGALEAFYPGAGHTVDNIVVYVKPAAVLFGGCLVRPSESSGLGNTTDADLGHWDAAVAAVKARYSDARIVVPSHGAPGTPAMLDHTISIVAEQRARAANP